MARGGVDPAGEAFPQHYVHASLDVTLPPGVGVSLPVDGTAGKRAQARKDAERILAEDSTQQRVRDLLARLAGG